jgi:hypothetical protein
VQPAQSIASEVSDAQTGIVRHWCAHECEAHRALFLQAARCLTEQATTTRSPYMIKGRVVAATFRRLRSAAAENLKTRSTALPV